MMRSPTTAEKWTSKLLMKQSHKQVKDLKVPLNSELAIGNTQMVKSDWLFYNSS